MMERRVALDGLPVAGRRTKVEAESRGLGLGLGGSGPGAPKPRPLAVSLPSSRSTSRGEADGGADANAEGNADANANAEGGADADADADADVDADAEPDSAGGDVSIPLLDLERLGARDGDEAGAAADGERIGGRRSLSLSSYWAMIASPLESLRQGGVGDQCHRRKSWSFMGFGFGTEPDEDARVGLGDSESEATEAGALLERRKSGMLSESQSLAISLGDAATGTGTAEDDDDGTNESVYDSAVSGSESGTETEYESSAECAGCEDDVLLDIGPLQPSPELEPEGEPAPAPTLKAALAVAAEAAAAEAKAKADDVANSDAKSVVSDCEESCFICLGSFGDDDPSEEDAHRIPLPCSNCSSTMVHAKCIYEWKERQQSGGDCPLCRASLSAVAYSPPDPLKRATFVMFEARRAFVHRPVPRDVGAVRCYMRVTPSGFFGGHTYELFLQAANALPYPLGRLPNGTATGMANDQLLMRARKRSGFTGHRIDMTLDSAGHDFDPKSPNYVGYVASNLLGLEHTICRPSLGSACAQELGAVAYAQNRLGPGVGPRKMKVLLAGVTLAGSAERNSVDAEGNSEDAEGNFEDAEGNSQGAQGDVGVDETVEYRPARRRDGLAAMLSGKSREELVNNGSVRYGANREPKWLDSIGAFSLDFKGRVLLASNKNFQLCLDDDGGSGDDVALQVGKVIAHDQGLPNAAAIYTCDVQWPLSPVQAFGIALTATDRKLMCA